MELAAFTESRASERLVPRHPYLHNYVKVAFFRGMSLRPVPPGQSKSKDTRILDIHEDHQFDEAQLARLGEASQPIARRTNVSARASAYVA
jgi:hypothetical protein